MNVWTRVLLGIGIAPRIKELPDGTLFRAYPAQHGPDWGWILRSRGRQNLTDKTWNACLLDGPWQAEGPNDPALDYIRNYSGSLRQDVNGWPKMYRDAFEQGHA